MRVGERRLCVTMTMVVLALAVDLEEELVHLLARARVEVAGGLVGQEELRLEDERARERHALLLAAGELAGAVEHAVREADLLEERRGRAAPSRRAAGPG